MGPVEVMVLGFPGNQFNGEVIPQLRALVDQGTISVVDGLIAIKDLDGGVTILEFDQPDASPEVALLAALVETAVDLVAEEDVEALVEALEPGSSAAVLVFEHTWAIPFRDAVVDSGGVVLGDLRVPGAVVDEVLEAVAELA